MQSKLFPWLLILGGIGVAIYGFHQAVGATEGEPTVMSIADLEAGKPVTARWLKVCDGLLVWPLSAKFYEEESGREGKTLGWYVPVVSRAVVDGWAQTSLPADGRLPMDGCRVLVYIKSNDAVLPDEDNPIVPFALTGTRARGTIDRRVKKVVRKFGRGMQWSKVIQIDHNVKPMQKMTAYAIGGGGIAAFLLGVGLMVWQRKRAAAPLSPPMHEKVAADTDAPPATDPPPAPPAPGESA